MKKVLAGLFCLFLCVGCQQNSTADSTGNAGSEAPVAQAAAEDLQTVLPHHNWVLKTVDGAALQSVNPDGSPKPGPNISFGQWPHLSGRFCNNYSGQMEIEGDLLIAKNMASTMMLCLDEPLSQLETSFYKMLNQGVKVKVENQTLTLTGDGRELVFEESEYVQ